VKTEETQNTKIVGDLPTFPMSGKTPNFDTGYKSSRRQKLGRFLNRNFDLSHFLFLLVKKFSDLIYYAI
jgi:hypothetical protein